MKPKILWMSTPNHSTGELISKEGIKQILIAAPNSLVVLDEAFIEYVNESCSCTDLVNKYSNLIVLRTFSKFYGLASLRIGTAITNPKIAIILEQFKLVFSIGVFTEKIAITTLHDKKYVLNTRKKIEKNDMSFLIF